MTATSLRSFLRLCREIALGTLGAVSYETYVARFRETHPGAEPMDYRTFFRNRQEARYDGAKGNSRCC